MQDVRISKELARIFAQRQLGQGVIENFYPILE